MATVGNRKRHGSFGRSVDNGWIFEGRITNSTQFQYHGYPVLPDKPIARMVYDRFRDWVERHPKKRNQDALAKCEGLYGFKK